MNKTGYIEDKKNKGKIYPKGEEVKYTTREGVESTYPNARGSHLVRIPGQGLQYLSRKEARRRSRSTPATKSNYDYQFSKYGLIHAVAPAGQGKRARANAKVHRPPSVSNHTAHRERQIMRLAQQQSKQEKANAKD